MIVLRLGLATLAVVLVTLGSATVGTSRDEPRVSLSVKPSAPAPQTRGRLPSGLRDYSVSFRVAVSADRECENLSVTYSYVALFDGRRSLAGSATDFFDTNRPASSASFDVHAIANAADRVSFSAEGACEEADETVLSTSAPVAAKAAVPAHSCERGPLRVLGARGFVRRQDLVARGARVRVRPGHYLWTGYRVWLGARSRIVYGARECRGFRVVVGGRQSFVPGDYSRGSYGTPTELGFGGSADFRGDQHSGGVETATSIALPRGKRTGPSKVARFQIVSFPKKLGRTTRVSVRSGTVYVAGRTGPRTYSPSVVVRAGQTTVVRCTSARACRPTAPR